jgi:glutamate-1-semialdehyde 2,1-aminomutase
MTTTNQAEFERAQKVLVGGVNSAVRAFRAVGGTPRFIARAQGAYMWDVEGKRYIDYLGSWGPMIVGHSHPDVVSRVSAAALDGLSYGAPNVHETLLAERLASLFPQAEKVRFTSSGTEAAMSALRLARGVTQRDKIIKFEGCYHGTADSLLVKAGSGALAFGVPSSAGVPADLVQHTLVANFNDLGSVKLLFEQHPESIACLIIEPIAGNMNLIAPEPGFLQGLRELCTQFGALLIFDEVMTGFRVALGGSQELSGVVPDMSAFGKVIGGGLPVGAIAAPAKYMDLLAPLGPVYQAGTLSGNPLAMAAGLATLDLIMQPGFYAPVVARCQALVDGYNQLAKELGVAFSAQAIGTMGGLYTLPEPPNNFAQINTQDIPRFKRFYHSMLEQGIYLPPSPFEAFFFSSALTDQDVEQTLAAAKVALVA